MTSDARKAALTAMTDQADAAMANNEATVLTMAEHLGHTATRQMPGPITRSMIDRLHARVVDHITTGVGLLCRHLSFTAPSTAYWLGYAPGRIRCGACATRTAERVRGTPEDRRCDHCRAVVPMGTVLFNHVATLPAVIFDVEDLPLAGMPPIVVMFGLCPSCHDLDKDDVG